MAALSAFLLSIVNNLRSASSVSSSHKHLTLSNDVVSDRAVFVIGDVHGCDDELGEIMSLAQKEETDPLFLLVGDLVNKGPKSVEVIRRIRSMGNSAFAVRGNHEESVLREVHALKSAGEACYCLRKKYTWIRELSSDDVAFLENLPYTITIPSLSAVIVHAGLVPGKPLLCQETNWMTNMRNIVDMGDPFEGKGLVATNKASDGEAWASLWTGPMHVYFGHDARRKLQLEPFATGLDTGCVYGGKLTGVFLNGCRKLLSVDAREMYIPP